MPSKKDISQTQSATTTAQTNAQNRANQYGSQAGLGYSNFANTGGVTPEEQALARQRTARSVSSLYDAGKRNLEMRNRIQGGYSPGYGANLANLNRQESADVGAATSDTELGLLEQIRQGKLAGLGGLSNLTGLYQGQIPDYLGIRGKLATAKPSLVSQIGDWARLGGQLGGAALTGFGGGGWGTAASGLGSA